MLDAGVVTSLRGVATMAGLLALPLSQIRQLCDYPGGDAVPYAKVSLLAPVDGTTEVWAAGVTYERSKDARVLESEDSADIYDRVYSAYRPELFFKSAAWRVVGPRGAGAGRGGSGGGVPAPAPPAVLNSGGEVVGYTICNDMSSRSIEGENPLYLPQAKIYL